MSILSLSKEEKAKLDKFREILQTVNAADYEKTIDDIETVLGGMIVTGEIRKKIKAYGVPTCA